MISQHPEWSLTKPIFVTVLFVAYAAACTAFLYPIYMYTLSP